MDKNSSPHHDNHNDNGADSIVRLATENYNSDDNKDLKDKDVNGNAPYNPNSLNQDAVEAAVMRYVGGDYNSWPNEFLNEEDLPALAAAASMGSNSSNLKTSKNKLKKSDDSSDQKKKKRKLSNNDQSNSANKVNALVDPELAQLDNSNEHDQLVQAAINDAKQLAHLNFEQEYILPPNDPNQNQSSNDGQNKHDDYINKAVLKHEVMDHRHQQQQQQQQHDQQASSQQHDEQFQQDSHQDSQHLQRDSQQDQSQRQGDHQQVQNVMDQHLNGITQMQNSEVASLVAQAASNASAFVPNRPQGKMFSKEEHEAIDKFISAYRQIHNMSHEDICKRIWSNNRIKDSFWDSLSNVLKHRTRASVYKHVRRAYHIFEVRGKWTPEEDEQLGALAKEKEGQWKAIGEIMGRMPEDCRDRWRNYVKCGTNRAQNKWSEEEENKLRAIINEVLTPQNPVINWTVVSEKMGGQRSRIQCRYKWNKLLKRQATVRASQMDQEDRLWLVSRLKELEFEENQVEWDALASLHMKNYWTGNDLKICYEKMRGSIKDYKTKSKDEICDLLIEELLGSSISNANVHHHSQQHQHHHQNNVNSATNTAPSNNMFDQMNQIVNDHHHQTQSREHSQQEHQSQPQMKVKNEVGAGDEKKDVDIASAAVAAVTEENPYLFG